MIILLLGSYVLLNAALNCGICKGKKKEEKTKSKKHKTSKSHGKHSKGKHHKKSKKPKKDGAAGEKQSGRPPGKAKRKKRSAHNKPKPADVAADFDNGPIPPPAVNLLPPPGAPESLHNLANGSKPKSTSSHKKEKEEKGEEKKDIVDLEELRNPVVHQSNSLVKKSDKSGSGSGEPGKKKEKKEKAKEKEKELDPLRSEVILKKPEYPPPVGDTGETIVDIATDPATTAPTETVATTTAPATIGSLTKANIPSTADIALAGSSSSTILAPKSPRITPKQDSDEEPEIDFEKCVRCRDYTPDIIRKYEYLFDLLRECS